MKLPSLSCGHADMECKSHTCMHRLVHRDARIEIKPPHQSQHATSYALRYVHGGCTFEHQQIITLELLFCKCSNKVLKQDLQSVTLSSESLCLPQWCFFQKQGTIVSLPCLGSTQIPAGVDMLLGWGCRCSTQTWAGKGQQTIHLY